jgi:molybdate transport system permease protein
MSGRVGVPLSRLSARLHSPLFSAVVILFVAIFAAFVALPGVAMLLNVRIDAVWRAVHEGPVRDALSLSIRTSLVSVLLCVLFGTPVAYFLARYRFPGKGVFDALVEMPMTLPPIVGGVALLMAFGRRGLLGQSFHAIGLDIPFTPIAVVMAQCFVAAPFFIQAARGGLEGVPRALEEASRTLGASEFRTLVRISLPLSWPAFTSGVILCWGRAIGEFGATIMFAGNMRGTTRTMPLAILTAMQGELNAALVLSVMLLVFSFCVFLSARLLLARRETR